MNAPSDGEVVDSAWPQWEAALQEHGAVVLPPTAADPAALLGALRLTERSTLSALVARTGGFTLDHGWFRHHGGGGDGLADLMQANGGSDPSALPFLLFAHDAVGGRFVLNGGGLDARPGEVCYLAPDTLRFECLGLGHSDFLWSVLDGFAAFAEDLRWDGWEQDLAALRPDQAIAAHPPPFTEQYRTGSVRRAVVSASELFGFLDDAARQLNEVPEGGEFDIRVTD